MIRIDVHFITGAVCKNLPVLTVPRVGDTVIFRQSYKTKDMENDYDKHITSRVEKVVHDISFNIIKVYVHEEEL